MACDTLLKSYCEPKITYFHMPIFQKHIRRFKIPMYHSMTCYAQIPSDDLFHNLNSLFLTQSFLLQYLCQIKITLFSNYENSLSYLIHLDQVEDIGRFASQFLHRNDLAFNQFPILFLKESFVNDFYGKREASDIADALVDLGGETFADELGSGVTEVENRSRGME